MAITDLTDEEFAEYIEGIRSGELPDESPEEAEEIPEDAEENTESTEENPGNTEENPESAEESPEEAEEAAAAEATAPEAERAEPQKAEEDGRITRLLRLARVKYPDEEESAAVEHLLGDIEDEEAASRGLEREDFINTADEADEFDRWKKEKAQNTQMQEKAAEKVREWRADEERIKLISPSFSLEEAMKNDEFKRRVLGGESVFAAYAGMNPSRPEKKAAEVDEAALRTPQGSGRTKEADPSKLPKAQFDEYIRRIKEG